MLIEKFSEWPAQKSAALMAAGLRLVCKFKAQRRLMVERYENLLERRCRDAQRRYRDAQRRYREERREMIPTGAIGAWLLRLADRFAEHADRVEGGETD